VPRGAIGAARDEVEDGEVMTHRLVKAKRGRHPGRRVDNPEKPQGLPPGLTRWLI